jgi:DNA-binding CsgD family transcriptional regulator
LAQVPSGHATHLSVVGEMMEDVPVDQSVTSPFVGRSDELDRLVELVGLSLEPPRAASVLVAGDAGVGKTRLLSEFAARAREAGWRVLIGHCLDFGDSALPYLPFSEIFGRLSAEAPGLTQSLAESYPSVRRLLPGRRLLSGEQREHDEPVERHHLFESVHAALERLAAAQPLLLVVEDVHWADQSTREMLSFCFARQFAGPVALVASYRTDDLHRRHPLRTTAIEWSRLPSMHRLQLGPLSEAAVRALVRAIHPAPLREHDIHAIVARAEGNAFFAEELVVATELGARGLPEDLADLLLVRLDQLDDQGRQVVRAAAVAGRRVSHALLSRVAGLDADPLERAMRAAVESNVLVPVGSESYAFRHALLAEAVYDDLLPGERVRLHAAYVQALCDLGSEGTPAELARHARAAHDVATAIRASIDAGDDAMSVGGPDEAAHHYELALELLADGHGGGEKVDQVELTLKASDALTASGHPHRSIALVQDQIAQLPAYARDEERARLLLALATAALVSDTNVDALELTSEALRLVPADPPSPLRAEVLTAHAHASADRQRDDDAGRWAGEALQLAEQLRLPSVAADATTTLARLEERAGDPDGSMVAFEKVVAEARANDDVMAELHALYNIASLHFEFGRLPESKATFQTATARAAEMGRPWAPYGLESRTLTGIVCYIEGDWDSALRTVDVSGQSPPALAEASLAAVDLSVRAGRGETDALALLDHLRPSWERDGMIAITSGSAAIDLHGDAGDLAGAIAVHDDVVETVTRLWQRHVFQARIRLSGLLLGQLASHAASASAAERPGLVRRGADLVTAADEATELIHGRRRPLGPEGIAWVARVPAEFARLRWSAGVDAPDEDELIAAWQQTEAAFEHFGHAFETARSRARLAAVLRAAGRAAEARAQAELARDVARRLRAEPLLAELRGLGAASGRRSDASRHGEALTPREVEILALVAKGRSNGEIGRQLFISTKTVSVHVSNILAKLRAGSRTEAAAMARRDGLLPE